MRSSPPVLPEGKAADVTDELERRAVLAQPIENRADASSIEARLTDEVRRFGVFFGDAAERLRAIGEDAGDDFDKLIVASQRLVLLQFSDAILKSMHRCCSLSEYVDNLGELELSIRDAFREVVLDGRKFLGVALTDECAREFFRAHQRCEKGSDVHVGRFTRGGVR